MGNYVLYKHVNKINGKVYYGVTNDVGRRWRNGGIEYKPYPNNHLRSFWNAICKYGFDNFEHIIVLDNLTMEEAFDAEIKHIGESKSYDKKVGYNISKGGNGGKVYAIHPKGMLGKNQTDFQKQSHTIWASDEKNNCMKNGKVVWGKTHEHPKGMLGKTHSEEFKSNVSKFMREQHPNFKKCYLIMPDGDEIEFKSPKFLCEHLKIGGQGSSIYQTMLRKPYTVVPQSNPKRYDLEGMMIRFDK